MHKPRDKGKIIWRILVDLSILDLILEFSFPSSNEGWIFLEVIKSCSLFLCTVPVSFSIRKTLFLQSHMCSFSWIIVFILDYTYKTINTAWEIPLYKISRLSPVHLPAPFLCTLCRISHPQICLYFLIPVYTFSSIHLNRILSRFCPHATLNPLWRSNLWPPSPALQLIQ